MKIVLPGWTRLRQVLLNLLSNAVQFTDNPDGRGEVVLSVRVEGDVQDGEGSQLHFTVRDTGIGLSEAGLSRLFQKFSQADSSTTRKYGGTGLGLAISKLLAELMGGRRVQASVMFSDIRGFTGMVEQQSPEETIELLNMYYVLMFDAINSHGGVVNQMVGDGLMAIFGAPLALDDPCGAAVRAAREMSESIELFNAERKAGGKPPLKVGMGIATGEVVAGYTGTRHRATYTCIGDTVNLAARLEAHTKEAQRMILIDGATHAGLAGRVPADALGPVQLKGLARPVDVFAVDA
ncbi:MAG: adenylate/guanylate cyclase domain-containing protein [Rubrivivax sp.]|nr:adenylate/guanylate cyclase domain-containing protein [Rubrivivax sp.]